MIVKVIFILFVVSLVTFKNVKNKVKDDEKENKIKNVEEKKWRKLKRRKIHNSNKNMQTSECEVLEREYLTKKLQVMKMHSKVKLMAGDSLGIYLYFKISFHYATKKTK